MRCLDSIPKKPILAAALTGLAFALPATALATGENIQCVTYARQLSGIQIQGDARTWWDKAAGAYARGQRPQVGAVLAFRPYGNMRLGHLATVSRVVDRRTVLVSHANWSRIDGTRGHVENNVKIVDVSLDNDWSRVRVWYTPLKALGGTKWPTYGFIYPKGRVDGRALMARAAQIENRPGTARAPETQSRSLEAQLGGDWLREAQAREQRGYRPPQASSGYRPGYQQTASARAPSSLGELLARY